MDMRKTTLFLGILLASFFIINLVVVSNAWARPCPGSGDFGDSCEDVSPRTPIGNPGVSSETVLNWGCSSNGSDRTCDFSYNFSGASQLYRFHYQNLRNDNPTPKVYWCINDTNAWGTGNCGTIQDTYNRDSDDGGINPNIPDRMRYFMVKIRTEQLFGNNNDFIGQFTVYRRELIANLDSVSSFSINQGAARPSISWNSSDALSGLMFIGNAADGTGSWPVPLTAPSGWTIPMNTSVAGAHDFTLKLSGPGRNGPTDMEKSFTVDVGGGGSNGTIVVNSRDSNGNWRASSWNAGPATATNETTKTASAAPGNYGVCIVSGPSGYNYEIRNAGGTQLGNCVTQALGAGATITFNITWSQPGAIAKYKCSGNSCIRDDNSGTYTSDNCNGACSVGRYKCVTSSSCAWVAGDTGADQCSKDSDCGGGPPGGYKCSANSCVWDATRFSSACATDSDCLVVEDYCANYVSQNVPLTMNKSQTYSVSVTMENCGNNTWTENRNYKLGSQNLQDNTTWGIDRVLLPRAVTTGHRVTFDFDVTAPSEVKRHNFQWRMLRERVLWFGGFTPNLSINVVNPTSAKYKCSGNSCVQDDANGTYASSNCDNACAPSSKIVSGNVFNDLNGNGVQDNGGGTGGNPELGVKDVDVMLRYYPADETTFTQTRTNGSGWYQFGAAGDWWVRVAPPAGWRLTTADSVHVNLDSSNQVVNFGIQLNQHNVCSNGACTVVAGPGSNECSTAADCNHTTCQEIDTGSYYANVCTNITTPGVSSCTVSPNNCPKIERCSLSINPNRLVIPPPATTTLSYVCQPEPCSISPAVNGVPHLGYGTLTASPTSTTSYTLTCGGTTVPAGSKVRVYNFSGGKLIEVNPGGQ